MAEKFTRFLQSVTVGAALILSTTQGFATELPSEIQAAMSANEQAFDPIHIELHWDRTTTLSDEKTKKVLRYTPGRPEFFGRRDARFKLKGNMVYSFIREQILRNYHEKGKIATPVEIERTFDGEKIYDGSGDTPQIGKHSALMIHKGEVWGNYNPDRRFADVTYYKHVGYVIPANNGDVVNGRRPTSMIRILLDERLAELKSVGSATVADSECVKLVIDDFERRHELYLDKALNYAVRQYDELTPDGEMLIHRRNEDFQRVGMTPLWLPKACTAEFHFPERHPEERYAEPVYSENFTVDTIDNGSTPDDSFVLTYGVGTWITDFTDEAGKVTYQIPADPDLLDDVIQDARDRRREENRRKTWMIVLVANACLAGGIGLAFFWIRRRRITAG